MLPMDFLPSPKPHHVEHFREIYAREFGAEIDEVEALRLLTQLSGLVYVKLGYLNRQRPVGAPPANDHRPTNLTISDEIHPLRSKEQR